VVCLISIVGTGRVGTAIAFLAASTSLDDILEIDLNENEMKSLHNSAATVRKFI